MRRVCSVKAGTATAGRTSRVKAIKGNEAVYGHGRRKAKPATTAVRAPRGVTGRARRGSVRTRTARAGSPVGIRRLRVAIAAHDAGAEEVGAPPAVAFGGFALVAGEIASLARVAGARAGSKARLAGGAAPCIAGAGFNGRTAVARFRRVQKAGSSRTAKASGAGTRGCGLLAAVAVEAAPTPSRSPGTTPAG